jgi:hypothetical protein
MKFTNRTIDYILTISGNINRRNILKTMGTSIAGASLAVHTVGASPRGKRVVTARTGLNNEPSESRRVPMKWYQHEFAMARTVSRLKKYLNEQKYIKEIYNGPSDQTTDGLYYTQPYVVIDEDAPATVESEVPSTVGADNSDIHVSSVRTKRTRGNIRQHSCTGNFDLDPFPGGLRIRNANEESVGTAGYPCHDDNGTNYILTCNHVVTTGCTVDTDVTVKSNDGEELGTPADGGESHDWAVVEFNDKDIDTISNEIYTEFGSVTPTDYKTYWGVSSLIGNNGAVRKQGVTTGTDTGTIKGQNWCGSNVDDPLFCTKYPCNAIKTETPNAGGDSGGPILEPTSDGANVITQVTLAAGNDTGNTASCNGASIYSATAGWPAYEIFSNNPYAVGKGN